MSNSVFDSVSKVLSKYICSFCATSRRHCLPSARFGVQKTNASPNRIVYALPSCRHSLRCLSVPITCAVDICMAFFFFNNQQLAKMTLLCHPKSFFTLT